jgi:hypothetical protein
MRDSAFQQKHWRARKATSSWTAKTSEIERTVARRLEKKAPSVVTEREGGSGCESSQSARSKSLIYGKKKEGGGAGDR